MAQRVLDLKQAQEIAEHCRKGLITAGIYFTPAYHTSQLVESIIKLADAIPMGDQPTREELTAANRRYSALNARYERLKLKHGEKSDGECN